MIIRGEGEIFRVSVGQWCEPYILFLLFYFKLIFFILKKIFISDIGGEIFRDSGGGDLGVGNLGPGSHDQGNCMG